MEVERNSLISQVVDILPHLGDGFVEACLAAYDWNVETAVAQILNEDLPPQLAHMDHSKRRYVPLVSNLT
jgi:activating signal cointegrator complex subunit 2